jgi:hypothetical protein
VDPGLERRAVASVRLVPGEAERAVAFELGEDRRGAVVAAVVNGDDLVWGVIPAARIAAMTLAAAPRSL